MLNQQQYDFAQLILKYYSPKIMLKKQQCQDKEIEEEVELEKNEKMDSKTKYSLDYQKFQNFMEKSDKTKPKTKDELEMEKIIESNPYLSQIACTHDRRKERELYDKSTQEKLDNAEYFKNEGNEAMKNGELDKASYFYQKALIHFDYTFTDTEEETKRYQLLQEQCNNNMAQCKMSQHKLDDAWNYCYQVLKLNPNNVKAKYRQAKIALIRDQYDQCEELLKQLDQQNQDVMDMQRQLYQKQIEYKQKNSKICQELFK